ncbi:hypothetical protein LshimejAT787_0401000 [Lyophyllum shimeji]|uniref:Uncharacterized protein n=1 Tax=Lyophyllum shimeji TaxID=47721 RepID=A0A9P3PKC4_LYOSH|nr:hypothetical protein LshimejAT787_0401000 [Lyophyllum shimeji]
MCQLSTEGTHYGCGHYVVTRTVAKRDCGTKYCMNSRLHMENCPHCPHCLRYYGPDYEQKITLETKTYCSDCEYWFKGPGSKPRK